MPHRFTVLGLALAGLISVTSLNAQTPAPDNTKVNARDRPRSAVTADQQKENAADRDLTQKIRQALVIDKSLSTYAHNVKVIAQGGQVTLKGPVRIRRRKADRRSQGGRHCWRGPVTNEMSIAPANRQEMATQ